MPQLQTQLADPPRIALRVYRIRQELTQDELAKQIGISSGAAISIWESGRSRPSVESAKAIESVTGIPWTTWFDEAAA